MGPVLYLLGPNTLFGEFHSIFSVKETIKVCETLAVERLVVCVA